MGLKVKGYKGVKSAYIGMETKIENYHLGFRVRGMTRLIENHIEHRKQNRQLNGNWEYLGDVGFTEGGC